MQDFKTGHLIGASPRAQFQGQLIGSFCSIFVTSVAFSFYSRAYPIPGPNFPVPTAFVWLNLARLLRSRSLPPYTELFMVLFGAASAVISGLKVYALVKHRKWGKWLPSGVAFAIGFLNTPSFSLARLVGGLIEYFWRKRLLQKYFKSDSNREVGAGSNITLIIVASGFVLGEGVASIINLALKMLGVGLLTCWGCAPNVCGGCP